MYRVFIGYDHRQPIAYSVLHHSIVSRASAPVSITPLILPQLPLKRQGLTPFTFSRFLVPYLCDYDGLALFLDIDMLCLGDICDLFNSEMYPPFGAVYVSKNKLRFEWASAMLFDCGHPDNRTLTLDHIERAEGLHWIGWTEDVGEIPPEWNHLVGYDEPRPDAKLVHFTQGVPAFLETIDSEYAAQWRDEARAAMAAQPWATLMGNSVHAKPVIERLIRQGKLPADVLSKAGD